MLQSEDDDGNTATAEKVGYLEHASLVYPLSELGMLAFRVDDVGSLCVGRRKGRMSSSSLREKSIFVEKEFASLVRG